MPRKPSPKRKRSVKYRVDPRPLLSAAEAHTAYVPSMPLTEVREQLSPLVQQIGASGDLAITVHGKVQAYLVSRARYEVFKPSAGPALPRPKIRGSIQIVGDIEEASREAGLELERYALESFKAELERD